ncbi:MAG: UDP-GlcNAc:undecaprenyl-phosphate/decaprenyl-phosphate GlcNAc-phosphate transferase [Chloroflexota bacterium]|nr:UDP-GlcNAc:undecaprenyl-phosphate/decaprenyl-phosphate GlcNAc-phosphate transferase [Chloroflexota bacterium]
MTDDGVKFIEEVGDSVGPILAVFVLAALLALLLTPVVRRVVLRYRIVDRPNARRVNTRPIPRAGGLAIGAAFLIVAGAFVYLNGKAGWVPTPLTLETSDFLALFLGGAAAAALGGIDDLFDLRARWQLTGQVVLAIFAILLGVGVTLINNPVGADVIRFSQPLSAGFTLFWIVGMINSINWIDGLDGLSSGIALIACVTLGLISLTTQVGQPLIAVLCFALAGALAGFLRWNFHPAQIFSGTSGVQFVGYTLAVLSILGSAKVAVALLVLGVPIIDTFWIIVGRVSRGGSPFAPDRSHIHHRLLDLGLSHRNTVLVIYGICAVLGVLAMLVPVVTQLYAFLAVFIVSGLILFGPTRGTFRRPDELDAPSYETADTTDR